MSFLANLAAGGPVDIWAFTAALVASAALALRSQMLRPTFHTLVDAPTMVWLSLSALGIACGGYAVTIASGNHAIAREAVLLTALAVSAVIMLINLRTQAKAATAAAAAGGAA